MDYDFLSSKQICLCVGERVVAYVWAAAACGCVRVRVCLCVYVNCVCEGGGSRWNLVTTHKKSVQRHCNSIIYNNNSQEQYI